MFEGEDNHIERNLNVIRTYLSRSFVGFDITEDKCDPDVGHAFSLMNRQTSEQVRLKVGWPRLSEECNTPERTMRSLEHGFVAGRMRNAKGDYFYW
jgi:hypothetical protein